jgi:hypothetical protein
MSVSISFRANSSYFERIVRLPRSLPDKLCTRLAVSCHRAQRQIDTLNRHLVAHHRGVVQKGDDVVLDVGISRLTAAFRSQRII